MPPVSAAQVQESVKKRIEAGTKLTGKTFSGQFDVQNPWVYWDTYVLDATATPTILFNNQTSRDRSLTNFPYMQLPAGQAFDIEAMRVQYYAHALMADATQQLLLTYLNQTVLQFQINNKMPSFERTLAGMFGGQMQVATAPAATIGSMNMTRWTANTVIRFKKKIEIDTTVPFTVNFLKYAANNAAITADYIRVELIGPRTCQL